MCVIEKSIKCLWQRNYLQNSISNKLHNIEMKRNFDSRTLNRGKVFLLLFFLTLSFKAFTLLPNNNSIFICSMLCGAHAILTFFFSSFHRCNKWFSMVSRYILWMIFEFLLHVSFQIYFGTLFFFLFIFPSFLCFLWWKWNFVKEFHSRLA